MYTPIVCVKSNVRVRVCLIRQACKQNNVLDEFEWIHIADFRVAKNKKVFAIMHDTFKDGSKLLRVEFKTKDVRRLVFFFCVTNFLHKINRHI